jgi:calcium-binding protein CML
MGSFSVGVGVRVGAPLPLLALVLLLAAAAAVSAAEEQQQHHEVAAGEEDEEEEISHALLATTIWGLLTMIICCTLVFESAKEYLIEHTSHKMQPVVHSLLSELTVLGFIGLIVFCLSNMSILTDISTYLFGEEELMTEMLEQIHYILFLVMVLFVGEVLALIHMGNAAESEWQEWNDDAMDEDTMPRLREEIKTFTHRLPKVWEWSRVEAFDKIVQQIMYVSLRSEFINGRILHSPFSPLPDGERLPADFAYDRYLTYMLAENMHHCVEVPNHTWLFMYSLITIFWFLMLACGDAVFTLAIVWLALGWVLCALMAIFHSQVFAVEAGLLDPSCIPAEVCRFRLSMGGRVSQNGGLLGWLGIGQRHLFGANVKGGKNSRRSSLLTGIGGAGRGDGYMTLQSHQGFPAWCEFSIPRTQGQPWWRTLIFGAHPTRQHMLFYFEANGPSSCIFLLRIFLLVQSLYVSVLLLVFVGIVWTHTEASLSSTFIYLLLGILPVAYMTLHLPGVTRRVVSVTSAGCLKSQEHISLVVREQKTARAMRALMLLNAMRVRAASGQSAGEEDISTREAVRRQRLAFWGLSSESEASRFFTLDHIAEEMEKRGLDPATIVEIGAMFDNFDSDGSGSLDMAEAVELMSSMGHPTTEIEVQSMMMRLDFDGDSTVSRDEFIAYQAEEIIRHREGDESMPDEEVARSLFRLFDRDQNGSISPRELAGGLERLKTGLSHDEIGDIVREVDHDSNGRVGEHEFVQLFLKHGSQSNEAAGRRRGKHEAKDAVKKVAKTAATASKFRK